jgi:hypothetical protein
MIVQMLHSHSVFSSNAGRLPVWAKIVVIPMMTVQITSILDAKMHNVYSFLVLRMMNVDWTLTVKIVDTSSVTTSNVAFSLAQKKTPVKMIVIVLALPTSRVKINSVLLSMVLKWMTVVRAKTVYRVNT